MYSQREGDSRAQKALLPPRLSAVYHGWPDPVQGWASSLARSVICPLSPDSGW